MQQIELPVRGMSCTGCERRIEKALARLNGVVRSAADYRKGIVRVAFDPTKTSTGAVRARIEQAGYEVEA